MRRTRSARWVVVDNGDGTFDLLRNGRSVKASAPIPVIQRYIGQNKARNDRVFSEEPDGYRTAI